MNNMLQLMNVNKSFGDREGVIRVLIDVSLNIEAESRVVFTGESGSGKTTLLSIISGLDEIDSGSILINGKEISKYSETKKAKFRLSNIGFVFQHHYLLQDFTALGNIMLPLIMLGINKTDAKKKALTMLEKVGLIDRKNHLPSQMSGGECQRTAIARALIHTPSFVLADEPTGALDTKNSEHIRDLLNTLVDEQGCTLIIATHDKDFLSIADTHWNVKDGSIQKMDNT